MGDDVKVTKTQVQPVMSNLQNQGLLAPEDVKEYQTKLSTRQKENVRVENVTKYMTMRVGVKPDYTLAPKADAHSDTPGYISFRPNMTKPMVSFIQFYTLCCVLPFTSQYSSCTILFPI